MCMPRRNPWGSICDRTAEAGAPHPRSLLDSTFSMGVFLIAILCLRRRFGVRSASQRSEATKPVPICGDWQWTLVGFVGSNIISNIFAILKEIGFTVVPNDSTVYTCCEVCWESIPVIPNGLGI